MILVAPWPLQIRHIESQSAVVLYRLPASSSPAGKAAPALPTPAVPRHHLICVYRSAGHIHSDSMFCTLFQLKLSITILVAPSRSAHPADAATDMTEVPLRGPVGHGCKASYHVNLPVEYFPGIEPRCLDKLARLPYMGDVLGGFQHLDIIQRIVAERDEIGIVAHADLSAFRSLLA